MNPQIVPTSSRDRETVLETLVIQAELGQDELVRAGVATLHPADVAELLNVLEEPELKQKIFKCPFFIWYISGSLHKKLNVVFYKVCIDGLNFETHKMMVIVLI